MLEQEYMQWKSKTLEQERSAAIYINMYSLMMLYYSRFM